MFNFGKLRLKWKVFMFLLGFCALLLVVLWLFQTVFLNDMYKFVRRQELHQVIATVEKEIDNPELPAILYDMQLEKDILVSHTVDFVPPQSPGSQRFNPRDQRGSLPFEAITETKIFTFKTGATVSLTFYALITPVSATVSTLRTQLCIITAIMFIFSVFLAGIISRRISKPIEDINRSALTLAEGKYDTRFSGKGFYEIIALSDTLNTAAIELGKVEGLRRDLLANVSHDLRTPLALIYSYAEMMNDFPGEITPEQTKMIMDETRRLTVLVNDILDLSKYECEMEQLNRSDFNLTAKIAETTERVGKLLKADGFKIIFNHDEDVYVNADETKIDRAFYNILINAVNYSGDSRMITVLQKTTGDSVIISILDNGEGIAEDDLPFIWDRYHKKSKINRCAATGTGFGLSIVKSIIELHGGSYGVVSEIGKGSTFWFELKL